jgi:hypothetical protein
MRLAKRKGDTSCYTRILTCINLLTDNGAKLDPTERDEWLLPKFRGGNQNWDDPEFSATDVKCDEQVGIAL